MSEKEQEKSYQQKLLGDQTIAVDKDGYLAHLNDWSETIAQHIAQEEGITMSSAHWEIIHALREFYQTFDTSPAMRPLVKKKLGGGPTTIISAVVSSVGLGRLWSSKASRQPHDTKKILHRAKRN